MNAKLFAGLTTTATALALMSMAAPAEALSLTSSNFGNSGITFDQDTEVEFTFWESHGKYKSIFGIIDTLTGQKFDLFSETQGYNSGSGEANDWKLTPEYIAVNPEFLSEPFKAVFKFTAGITYQLAYWGSNHTVDASAAKFQYDGTHTYLTTGPNWKGPQQFNTLTVDGSVIIGMEDGWERANNRGAGDFNDFIVSARLVSAADVPEPTATLALLGVGGAGLFGLRRRRAQSSI
ncbi:MAG: PEP-CTERM sorting domain-containing protein [Desertifilum sp. SIO1I2]|nr:PEP-CTERM sorting domain-containing protein [Desertifilum sp. SIO1I2]